MIIVKGRRIIVPGGLYPYNFTFTLPANTTTSAGIYNGESLVRTLWNNEKYEAGEYTVSWDGKDDLGNTISNLSAHHAEVLRGNVIYEWKGVIGNSSNVQVGSNSEIMLTATGIKDMVCVGSKLYYCMGWYEQHCSEYIKDLSNINNHVPLRGTYSFNELSTYYCTTDGNYIYWAGYDTQQPTKSWVWATKVSDNSEVVFSNGTPTQQTQPGAFYASAIDYDDETVSTNIHRFDGFSVQTNGNFLFLARGRQNKITVTNKTTGAHVNTISMSGVTALATDLSSNGLWIAQGSSVKKYTINTTTGAITDTGISLSGCSRVTYLKITPDGTTIAAVDAGANQQVKGFNNSTGALTKTLGQQGGYLTNADATNFKFAFGSWPVVDDLNNPDYAEAIFPYITFQPDGKIWVGDVNNNRTLRYSADWSTYIDGFYILPATITSQTHPVDNTRVFASGNNSVEFAIDYSKTLDNGTNGSWKLKANWFASLSLYYDKTYIYGILQQITNGRTYATVVNKINSRRELFEMVVGGTLRNTGLYFKNPTLILPDGTLIQSVDVNPPNPYNWYRKSLIGYTGNNPNWGVASGEVDITFSVSPFVSIVKDDLDANSSIAGITASGKLINFDGSTEKGWHLQGIELKTDGTAATSILWKACPSTRKNYHGDFPKDGTYDIGNNVVYSGGDMRVFNGNNIIWSYHGEFWKSYQTNYYNHFWENGLMAGQFGRFRFETAVDIDAEVAGNAAQWGISEISDDEVYLYHPDESVHSGIGSWQISGLTSITVESIALGTNSAVAPLEGIDLMAGFNPSYTDANSPTTDFLPSGQFGWLQTPATNDGTTWEIVGSTWRAIIGTKTFSKNKAQDLYIRYFIAPDYTNYDGTLASIPKIVHTVTRDLTIDAENGTGYNTSGATSWKLWGYLDWSESDPNVGSSSTSGGGQYMEVLDSNDKVISRIYPYENTTGSEIRVGNDVTLVALTYTEINRLIYLKRPLEIYASSAGIRYSYNHYTPITTAVVDPTSNWQNPKTLRFYFWTKNDEGGRNAGVNNLRFVANH